MIIGKNIEKIVSNTGNKIKKIYKSELFFNLMVSFTFFLHHIFHLIYTWMTNGQKNDKFSFLRFFCVQNGFKIKKFRFFKFKIQNILNNKKGGKTLTTAFSIFCGWETRTIWAAFIRM
jgi:hypothetical protein